MTMNPNSQRTVQEALQGLELEPAQAQAIVDKHLNSPVSVENVVALQTRDYSFSKSTKFYMLDCRPSNQDSSGTALQTCFLLLSRPLSPGTSKNDDLEYHPNNLEINHHLLSLIASKVHPPDPSMPPILSQKSVGYLDTSLETLPCHYILTPLIPFPSTSIITLAEARKWNRVSPHDLAAIELRLGYFFGQLHSQVQNDWYGMPAMPSAPGASSAGIPGLSISINEPPHESGYSWQETFIGLMEDLLLRLKKLDSKESPGVASLPYEDIQRYLSRAIGSFLFDDVEVPSLIWFTLGEEDIYIVDPQVATDPANSSTIATILPSLTHAIWGDPLLEYFMLGSGGLDILDASFAQPSQAFMEGYKAGGGKNLIVFPRNKTKRVWYTVFLALVTLVGDGVSEDTADDDESRKRRKGWAREILSKCGEKLKDAPCY